MKTSIASPRIWAALLALTLSMAPFSSHAQPLAAPAEFYFDEDRAAMRELDSQRGEGDALVSRLLRSIERDPRAWGAMARLGDIAISSGRVEAGRGLYERAIAGAGDRHGLSRSIRWHYGWALYRTGDAEGALAQWAQLVADGGIRGQWMPPTLALVLWKLDRREEAVKWYAAAVRTEPNQWASPDLSALLPQWRAEEHAALLEVQRAWAERPQ